MSNSNKLEITITATENILDEKKLKQFFVNSGCENIKKIKVLKERKKAFVTFCDVKSYEKALNISPYAFTIVPTNINLSVIYERQNTLKRQLNGLVESVNELGYFIEDSFYKINLTMKQNMLLLSGEMDLNVAHIADEMKKFEMENIKNCEMETNDEASSYDEISRNLDPLTSQDVDPLNKMDDENILYIKANDWDIGIDTLRDLLFSIIIKRLNIGSDLANIINIKYTKFINDKNNSVHCYILFKNVDIRRKVQRALNDAIQNVPEINNWYIGSLKTNEMNINVAYILDQMEKFEMGNIEKIKNFEMEKSDEASSHDEKSKKLDPLTSKDPLTTFQRARGRSL